MKHLKRLLLGITGFVLIGFLLALFVGVFTSFIFSIALFTGNELTPFQHFCAVYVTPVLGTILVYSMGKDME
jgi:TRAP-type C4-dicarboxylate transport system permease small subunit